MKKILIPIIMLMILSSCEGIFNSEPALPPVTTTGENTFGCVIDGKGFLPNFESFWWADEALYAIKYENVFIAIGAHNQNWNNGNKNCNGSWVKISLHLDSTGNFKGTGSISFMECRKDDSFHTNRLKNYTADLSDDLKNRDHFEVLEYYWLDSYNLILACKFQATVISENGDIKRITDGRFDVKIN